MKYLAAIHQNMPDDPAALKARATKLRKAGGAKKTARAERLERLAAETPGTEAVKAGGLRVGDKFTHGGQEFRVAEDANGFRVLSGPREYDGTPIDALTHVPLDKGSFRPGKLPRRQSAPPDAIPFSADAPPTHYGYIRGMPLSARLALSASDLPRSVRPAP